MISVRAGTAVVIALLLAIGSSGEAQISGAEGLLSAARGKSEIVLGGPVALAADTLYFDEDTGVALAEGNVEIGYGNRTIRADRIRYDSRSGEAELMGKVHYKDSGDEFSFDRIVINVDTEKGVLYNGSIRLATNNYLISSEKFEKTGPMTFSIQKGSLTTCPCDPIPDWKIDVRRSVVTIDGYAVGKDVTFRIRDVPVLWLPWAAFPVKLSRQSGFLIPVFSTGGSKGTTLTLPYYWAISRWNDATLTLEAMSRRGIRPEGEFRFALNPSSEGDARASYFHDKEAGRDRYRVYGINSYRNEDRWTSNAQWDFVSDGKYYNDLVDSDNLRTARAVPSRGFVGKDTEDGSQSVSAVWVTEIQNPSGDNTVQRIPEISASVLPRQLWGTGVEAAGDVAGTFFYRSAGNRELRGRTYWEATRTFTLYPSVTMTPFLSLDLMGSSTVSDWTGSGTGTQGRILPGAGGSLEADFRRGYERGQGTRMIHLISPSVSFRWIPSVDQSAVPVVDQWSRVAPQRQFLLSVAQRVLRTVDGVSPMEVASLSVEWAMEIGGETPVDSPYLDPLSPYVRALRDQIDVAIGRGSRVRKGESDVYARARLHPAPRWSFTGETLYGVDTGKMTLAAAGGEWKRNEDNRVSFEYRQSRDLSEDIHGQIAVRPFRLAGLKTNANYSVRNGNLTDGSATLMVYPRSDCWSVGFVATRKENPYETNYKLLFALKGIGTVGN